MSKTQKSTMRPNKEPDLRIVTPVEDGSTGVLAAAQEGCLAAMTGSDSSSEVAMAVEASGWAVVGFELPAGGIAPAGLLRMLPACVDALEKAARELGLSPEQQDRALLDCLRETERRLPQLVVGLFVLSQLPEVAERAFRHFHHQRHMAWHDAKELSQEMVLKILSTLTKTWPHGNVGAWLTKVRENMYRDHWRKCDRDARKKERAPRRCM
jgi:hypothetical protein